MSLFDKMKSFFKSEKDKREFFSCDVYVLDDFINGIGYQILKERAIVYKCRNHYVNLATGELYFTKSEDSIAQLGDVFLYDIKPVNFNELLENNLKVTNANAVQSQENKTNTNNTDLVKPRKVPVRKRTRKR